MSQVQKSSQAVAILWQALQIFNKILTECCKFPTKKIMSAQLSVQLSASNKNKISKYVKCELFLQHTALRNS